MKPFQFPWLLVVLSLSAGVGWAQEPYTPARMDPARQPTTALQYFKPAEPTLFCGDPMPFFHNGVFHVYYLLDKDHHGYFKNPGYHQWAHMTSTDLVHWQHQPMALEIDDLTKELSICTGSVTYHDGTFYAFYATRAPDATGTGTREYLSLATSTDGVRFNKQPPLTFATPPPAYDPRHYRDPFVFRNPQDGLFYMLVSTAQRQRDYPQQEGKLVYLTSPDMKNWTFGGDFLTPAYARVPECADWFAWNGWYYLLFSVNGGTRYRMSKSPTGPWQVPPVDNLSSDWLFACKSAAFTGNRRLLVGFVPWRENDQDNGRWLWGGNLLFRELKQAPDGTLRVVFPAELQPALAAPQPVSLPAAEGVTGTADRFTIRATDTYRAVTLPNVPVNARLTCLLRPTGWNMTYGLHLRQSAGGSYNLALKPAQQQADLGSTSVVGVPDLNKPLRLEVLMRDDIIDVCIDGRRCLINRTPEQRGNNLQVYVHNGTLTVETLRVEPLR